MSEWKRAYNVLRSYVGQQWDRIEGLERISAETELDSLRPRGSAQNQEPKQTVLDAATARKILGVSETDSFEVIRATYDRLVKRCDPSRFPEGSEERKWATDIHRRIHHAYALLLEQATITEKRFGTLEID